MHPNHYGFRLPSRRPASPTARPFWLPQAGREVGSPSPESRVPPWGGRGERCSIQEDQLRALPGSRTRTGEGLPDRSGEWDKGRAVLCGPEVTGRIDQNALGGTRDR